MSEPAITCPKCNNKIKLTESLAAPLIEATEQRYAKLLKDKDIEISNREGEISKQKEQLVKEKSAFEQQVAGRVEKEVNKVRTVIAAEEEKKIRHTVDMELERKGKEVSELQETINTLNDKLFASQEKEAEFLKERRLLNDEKREMKLTIEKTVQKELEDIRQQAHKEAEESKSLAVAEKDLQINSMRKTIAELERKATQGSQQIQGEVQELELERILQNKFPDDTIEPVAKGEFGGDIIQHVVSTSGRNVGKILWESKRTKNWNNDWLIKLKNDQRLAEAEIAIMVTQVLPKNVRNFEQIDGIWITQPETIIPLAVVLRQTLLEVFRVKKFSEGQKTKMEILYQYLTGERFRNRVIAIVETFSSMQKDLEKERKVMTKQWDKRRMQIEKVMDTTVGMHGDLQGIVGEALKEIEGLEIESLEYENKG